MRFILIDEILELTPGESILAVRNVDPAEDYFRDHFPGFPVVPGVLLTEMMAQAAGKCLDAERPERGKAMLARIRSASFRQWVSPGTRLLVRGRVRTSQEKLATADCLVEADLETGRRKVASADLLFSFVPRESFAGDYRDEVLEAFLARARNNRREEA